MERMSLVIVAAFGLVVGISIGSLGSLDTLRGETDIHYAIVESSSMAPTFKKGDIIGWIETDNLKVGDIVVYSKDGKLIAHRLIEIENNKGRLKFRTKGDANGGPDRYWVDNIIGKVVEIRYEGWK